MRHFRCVPTIAMGAESLEGILIAYSGWLWNKCTNFVVGTTFRGCGRLATKEAFSSDWQQHESSRVAGKIRARSRIAASTRSELGFRNAGENVASKLVLDK